MKISFLVTYYNQEQYVHDSIESILRIEKTCDWEILVGDDGSSDHTRDKVNEYIAKYPANIHLYQMPRNDSETYFSVQRASANRLNLLQHSTGDYFCVLDGDDLFCDKSFVNEAIAVFAEYKDAAAVGFGFGFFTDDDNSSFQNGKIKFDKTVVLSSGFDCKKIEKKRYLRNSYIHAGACVFRKCFNDKRISFLEKVGYYDDNDILINQLAYGELYSIPKVIYAYRQTGTSVYTSMNQAEQAVLNMLGYDVDSQFFPQMKKELVERNLYSIIFLFLFKSKLVNLLGNKLEIYMEACNKIESSLTFKMLTYNDMLAPEKIKIDKFVLKAMATHLVDTFKALIKIIVKTKKSKI